MIILSKLTTLYLCTMALLELTSPVNRRPFTGHRPAAFILALEYLVITYVAICVLTHNYAWQSVLTSASLAVVTDFFAFVIGKSCGHHKVAILRHISPNKSWEGYFGGFTAGLIFARCCHLRPVFAVISILASMCGDLASSLVKRGYGLKDFNEVILSLDRPILRLLETPVARCGGYMDRMDSISYALLVLIVNSLTLPPPC